MLARAIERRAELELVRSVVAAAETWNTGSGCASRAFYKWDLSHAWRN